MLFSIISLGQQKLLDLLYNLPSRWVCDTVFFYDWLSESIRNYTIYKVEGILRSFSPNTSFKNNECSSSGLENFSLHQHTWVYTFTAMDKWSSLGDTCALTGCTRVLVWQGMGGAHAWESLPSTIPPWVKLLPLSPTCLIWNYWRSLQHSEASINTFQFYLVISHCLPVCVLILSCRRAVKRANHTHCQTGSTAG